MNVLFKCLAATLLAACTLAARAGDGPLDAFVAEYQVTRNGSALGEATIELRQLDGERWRLTTHTRGTAGMAALVGADIQEASEFFWVDRHPQLLDYRFKQKAAWKTKVRELHADEENQRIESRDGDKHYDLALDGEAMDRHTVVLAIAADLRADAQELVYTVVDKDKIEPQRYRRDGEERVTVPAGTYRAFRVERVREKPGRTTTSWIAPDLGWIPIRVVQREPDGETIEMRLKVAPRD